MLRKIRELLRDEQGFTLVELMVVIVILGILAGIGIPTYNNFVKRAYEAEIQVAERTLKLGLELYRVDEGVYPEVETVNTWISDLNNEYVNDWPADVYLVKYKQRDGTFTLQHDKIEKRSGTQ